MDFPTSSSEPVLMPDGSHKVEREVPPDEAADWVLAWAQQGWIPVGTAEPLRADGTGARMLRFTLSHVEDDGPMAPPLRRPTA